MIELQNQWCCGPVSKIKSWLWRQTCTDLWIGIYLPFMVKYQAKKECWCRDEKCWFFCIYYTRPLTLPPALLIWFSFFDKTLQGISWESKLANIAGLLVSSSPISKSKIYRRKGGIYLDCADCWEGRISGQWQRCARGVQLTRPGRFHTNLTICDDWQPGRSVNMVERFWSNDGHTLRREGRLLLVSLVGRN